MTQKIKILHPLLFLFCLCLLVNCKSDKPKSSEPIVTTTTTEKSKEDEQIATTTKNQDTLSTQSQVDSTLSQDEEVKTVEDPTTTVTKEKKPEVDAKPPKKKSKKKHIRAPKPKIQFEQLTWNFGEITEGDIVEKKFKFTNTGNAPLQIIATSATCGCTRPSFPFLDIAPGESNVIGVSYNSVGKDGEQNPEVTVESNTYPKVTTLKLFGVVKPKKEEKPSGAAVLKDTTTSNQ